MAEDFAVLARRIARLEPLRPNEYENRVIAQEQSVRAVIDILPAEVPEVEGDRRRAARAWEGHGRNRDAVSRVAFRFERLTHQIAAELRLADAPVAQHHQLDVLDARVVRSG